MNIELNCSPMFVSPLLSKTGPSWTHCILYIHVCLTCQVISLCSSFLRLPRPDDAAVAVPRPIFYVNTATHLLGCENTNAQVREQTNFVNWSEGTHAHANRVHTNWQAGETPWFLVHVFESACLTHTSSVFLTISMSAGWVPPLLLSKVCEPTALLSADLNQCSPLLLLEQPASKDLLDCVSIRDYKMFAGTSKQATEILFRAAEDRLHFLFLSLSGTG